MPDLPSEVSAHVRRALAQAGLPDEPAMQREVERVLLRLQPLFPDLPGIGEAARPMQGGHAGEGRALG